MSGSGPGCPDCFEKVEEIIIEMTVVSLRISFPRLPQNYIQQYLWNRRVIIYESYSSNFLAMNPFQTRKQLAIAVEPFQIRPHRRNRPLKHLNWPIPPNASCQCAHQTVRHCPLRPMRTKEISYQDFHSLKKSIRPSAPAQIVRLLAQNSVQVQIFSHILQTNNLDQSNRQFWVHPHQVLDHPLDNLDT